MNKSTLAAVIVSAIAGTTIIPVTMSAPAMARDSFAFSFDTGNVRVAYRDGYYDHNRRWHAWRRGEAAEYRVRFRDRYYDGPRSRYPNRGWRDNDGDGVPNRYDDRPNNPYRD